jgi:hypothetical protein
MVERIHEESMKSGVQSNRSNKRIASYCADVMLAVSGGLGSPPSMSASHSLRAEV